MAGMQKSKQPLVKTTAASVAFLAAKPQNRFV